MRPSFPKGVRSRHPDDIEVDPAVLLDLGIVQSFSRARTPTDNAACESWIATIKCEHLYDADTAEMTSEQVESMIDRSIGYYNNERLHQAIDYVTPAERHDGRHTAIIEARKQGMQEAKRRRRMDAYAGRSGETDG